MSLYINQFVDYTKNLNRFKQIPLRKIIKKENVKDGFSYAASSNSSSSTSTVLPKQLEYLYFVPVHLGRD